MSILPSQTEALCRICGIYVSVTIDRDAGTMRMNYTDHTGADHPKVCFMSEYEAWGGDLPSFLGINFPKLLEQ